MNDKIEELLKQPWTIPTIIGILSFGGGVGLGWFLANRKNESVDIHEVPAHMNFDLDIEEVKDEESVKPPKVVIPEEVAVSKGILTVHDLSELRPEMLDREEGKYLDEIVEEMPEPEPITVEATDDIVGWDWEEEVKNRSSSAPYILHQDEFYADELNYTQMTLTYYAGDNIMTDEDDKPVFNHSNVTGELRFGHGSRQPNVVHIRNDERRAEYEVTMLDALYSVEILGLEIENNERVADLKHSKVQKFRMD